MENTDILIRQLYQATRIIAKQLNRLLGGYELHSSEWTVIASIQEKGVVSQIVLADHLNIEPSAISKSLVALEKKGLIQREEGADKREKLVSLTAKALELYPQWEKIVREHRTKIMQGVSADQMLEVQSVLTQIFRNAQEMKKEP